MFALRPFYYNYLYILLLIHESFDTLLGSLLEGICAEIAIVDAAVCRKMHLSKKPEKL